MLNVFDLDITSVSIDYHMVSGIWVRKDEMRDKRISYLVKNVHLFLEESFENEKFVFAKFLILRCCHSHEK